MSMIKALWFETRPEMDSVGAIEILDELNPLIKDNRSSTIIPLRDGHKMIKDSYITKNFFIMFLKIDDPLTFESMLKIYEVLQLSIPNFLKVLNVNNTIIVATPRYDDAYENASYSVMMDELVRFTTYCLKRTGDDLTSSIMLKEYVELFVNYGK